MKQVLMCFIHRFYFAWTFRKSKTSYWQPTQKIVIDVFRETVLSSYPSMHKTQIYAAIRYWITPHCPHLASQIRSVSKSCFHEARAALLILAKSKTMYYTEHPYIFNPKCNCRLSSSFKMFWNWNLSRYQYYSFGLEKVKTLHVHICTVRTLVSPLFRTTMKPVEKLQKKEKGLLCHHRNGNCSCRTLWSSNLREFTIEAGIRIESSTTFIWHLHSQKDVDQEEHLCRA